MADVSNKKTEQSQQEVKNPKSFKKYIILAGIVLFQVVISYIIIAYLMKPSEAANNEPASQEKVDTDHKSDATEGIIVGLDDIVINPSDTKGRRFVFISLGIELEPGKTQEEIKKRLPAISDAVITLLSQKNLSEFIEVANRDILRQEVLLKIKEVTSSNLVHQIYFTKFIIR